VTLRRIHPGDNPWPSSYETLPDVEAIVADVKRDGDVSVARAASVLGDRPPRRVPRHELLESFAAVEPSFGDVMRATAGRIERFARAQRAALTDTEINAGGMQIGHRIEAIEHVGIYVPGGRYPLASSVLMCAIPARIAGVSQITMCTPHAAPETLAAAHYAGVDICFEIGGAQAIAAMAFGTQTVPKVDLIVGPGNAYVAAAKRSVFGVCGIDMVAGPSELLILASDDADAKYVAADLLAQAEHDADARVMLMTDDPLLADRVNRQLCAQLPHLSTTETAESAIRSHGCYAVLPLRQAVAWANALAIEHVSLQGSAAITLTDELRAYGALFIGSNSAQVFGDYGVGPNHVLPTGTNARFASGLSVLTFLAVRTYQRSSGALDLTFVSEAASFAASEGLDAHRLAALARCGPTARAGFRHERATP
jgi:histidinol dehydrogenase